MDPSLQQRYFDLRKQLTSLNYSSNFGVDAIEVVHQLFTDLVATTESYSQLQEKEYSLSQDLSLAQAQLFPLRKDNAKLSRENQQLHLETIKLREDLSNRNDSLSMNVKQLKEELQEARYLCMSKDEDIAKIERERLRIREAYEALASSSLLSNGVKVKRSIKSTFALDGVSESKTQSPEENKKKPSRISNRTAKIARDEEQDVMRSPNGDGDIIETLRKQVEALESALASSKEESRKLSESLSRRDDELIRFARKSGVLDSGVSNDETRMQNLLAADSSNKRIIDQLNGQVDFLNEQLALRERQLAEHSRELSASREVKAECEYRGVLLDREKAQNKQLLAQLVTLESRINEVNRVTDPSTPIQRTPESVSSSSRSSPQFPSQSDVVERLAADKQVLNSEVQALTTTLSQMEEGDSLLKARLNRTEQARLDLLKQLDKCRTECSVLSTSLSDTKLALDQSIEENSNLKEKLETVQRRCEEEAQNADDHRSRVLGLESQLSVLEASKSRLETALRELKMESAQLRKSQTESHVEVEQSQQFQRRWEKEKESLLNLLKSTQEELSECQDTILKKTHEQESVSQDLHHYKEKVSQYQAKLSNVNSLLESKSEEVSELVDSNVQQKRQIEELKFELKQRRSGTEDRELKKQEEKYSRLTSDFDLLKQSYTTLEQQYANSLKTSEIVVSERDTLVRELHDKEDALEALESKNDKIELELHRLNNQLALSSTQHTTALQSPEQNELVHQQQQSITHLESELRLSTRRISSLETSLSETQQSLIESESALSNANAKLQSLTLEKQKYLTQVDQLTDEISNQREIVSDSHGRLEEYQRRLVECKADLRTALQQKEDSERACDELKTLLRAMESNEKSKSSNQSRWESELKSAEQRIDALEADKATLKQELASKDRRIKDLHDSLVELDRERDDLQLQLDNESSLQDQREATIAEYSRRLEDMTSQIGQKDKQLCSIKKEVMAEGSRVQSLEQRLKSVVHENNELKKRLHAKHSEVGAASEDLMMLTKENQSLTSELADVSGELDRLRSKYAEETERCASLEQAVRSLEIERSDLLETYRCCLQEKRKCEADLSSMSATKLKMSQTINELRADITDLSTELTSRRNSENRQLSERSALMLQIESLNEQLVATCRKVEDHESDANRLAQENYGLKQTILTLQQRSVTLVNRAASAADSAKILQARVSALERERDALRSVVDSERRKSSDLTQIVLSSRSRDARQASVSPEQMSRNISRSNTTSPEDTQTRILQGTATSSLHQSKATDEVVLTHTSESETSHAEKVLGISSDDESDDITA
mmetsp:Transcript_21473/g.31144  ORF Transcript_21473/g.31144 Transcript_21473/m.31144 type:complete len:1310 (-) Transcript_21473:121-4050(-)